MRQLKQTIVAVILVIVFTGTINAKTILMNEVRLFELAESYIELSEIIKTEGLMEYANEDTQVLLMQSFEFLGFVTGIAQSDNELYWFLPEDITSGYLGGMVAHFITKETDREPNELASGVIMVSTVLIVMFPENR